MRQRQGGGGDVGGCLDRSLRVAGEAGKAADAAKRQWFGVHVKALHGDGAALRLAAGVHPAAHATAERHDRALLPDREAATQ